METIFLNKESSKTNESYKFVVSLQQRLDLKNSDKFIALQNLYVYYKQKTMRQQYKNIKLKIVAPTWTNDFELPDGSYSVSVIQDYIEYIRKTRNINRDSWHLYLHEQSQ